MAKLTRPAADRLSGALIGTPPGPAKMYLYTDRDGAGVQDPAIRAYGSPWVGKTCVRAGAWKGGKALVRFGNTLVVVRSRLLRLVDP